MEGPYPIFRFILFLSVFDCASPSFSIPGLPSGTLTNDKNYTMYYVGETLTLYCTKPEGFMGQPVFSEADHTINHPELVTKINSTHAVLEKVVMDDDLGSTRYSCEDNAGAVALAFNIQTDYVPTNATDLQLVWLDEKMLFITWQFGNVTYKNTHTALWIPVSAEWSLDPKKENSWNLCYNGPARNYSCKDINMTNEWAEVHVRVNITNVKRKETVSTLFPGLRVKDHVKPSPAKEVNVTALSSTAASLSWTVSQPAELVYNVTYYTVEGGQRKEDWKKSFNKFVEIPELHPHYTYKFEVRSRYINRGYWSDLPEDIPSLQMPEDAPSQAPVITPGSFYLDVSNYCSLYLYYQAIPEEYQNGVITKFTAQAQLAGSTVAGSQSGSPHTIKMGPVPCGRKFNITLYANTAMGSSPATQLFIPASDPDLDNEVQKLKLRIQVRSSGSVTAEWNPVTTQPDVSFLVYFCDKNIIDNSMCEGAISYINISTSQTESYQLPLSAHANMKFGVAAIRGTGDKLGSSTTNGINFTNCIYDPLEAPGSPPSLVPLKTQNGKITISWKAQQECSADRRVIIFNYEIEACPVTQSSACRTYIAEPGSLLFEIADAKLDVNHTVRIRVNTSSSFTKYSAPVFAMAVLPDSGLNAGEIAGIISAVLVVLLITGAVLYCFRRKWKRNKSHFKDDCIIPAPPPVIPMNNSKDNKGGMEFARIDDDYEKDFSKDPSMTGSTHDEQSSTADLVHQESNDSGCPSDSLPSSPTDREHPYAMLNECEATVRPDGYSVVTTTVRPDGYSVVTTTVRPDGYSVVTTSDSSASLGVGSSLWHGGNGGGAANEERTPGHVPLAAGHVPRNQLLIPVPAAFESEEDEDSASPAERRVGDYIQCSTADNKEEEEGDAADLSTPVPAGRDLFINFAFRDSPMIPVPRGFHDARGDFAGHSHDIEPKSEKADSSHNSDCVLDGEAAALEKSPPASQQSSWQPGGAGIPSLEGECPSPTPSQGGGACSHGYAPNSLTVTPEITSSTPSTSGYVPEKTALTPSTSGYVPEKTAVTPRSDGYLPNTDLTPSTEGCDPENTASTPSASVYVSEKTASTPRTNGYVPENTASTPRTSGCVPENTASTPSASGYVSENTASTPSASGYVSENTASTPSTSGYVPEKTAVTPRSDGYLPNTDLTPSTEGCDPENTASTPSTSGYVSEKTASTPRTNGYVPENTASTPSAGGYVSENTASTPSASGYVSENTASTPSTNGYVPEKTASTPRTSGYVSEKTASTPSTNGYVPEKTAVTPKSDGYVPNTASTPSTSGYVPEKTALTPRSNGYVPNTYLIPSTEVCDPHNTASTQSGICYGKQLPSGYVPRMDFTCTSSC